MISLEPVNNKVPTINTDYYVNFREREPLLLLENMTLSDEDEYCVGYDTIEWARLLVESPRSTESLTLEVRKVKFVIVSLFSYFLQLEYPWLVLNASACNSGQPAGTTPDDIASNMATIFYSSCDGMSQLVFSGRANLEQYQTVLRSVVYFENALEPITDMSTVSVSVIYNVPSYFSSTICMVTAVHAWVCYNLATTLPTTLCTHNSYAHVLYAVLQVYVDDGVNTNSTNVSIMLQFINDEPPRVYTNGTVIYFEEHGEPVAVTGSAATIRDSDNIPDHQRVDRVCVEFAEPYDGDTVVLDSNNTESVSDTANGGICIDFSTCNNDFVSDTCFNSILTSIKYASTEDEPVVAERTIRLTVSKTSAPTCMYLLLLSLYRHMMI